MNYIDDFAIKYHIQMILQTNKLKLDEKQKNFLGNIVFKNHFDALQKLNEKNKHDPFLKGLSSAIISNLNYEKNNFNVIDFTNISFNDLSKSYQDYFIEFGINLIKTGAMKLV